MSAGQGPDSVNDRLHGPTTGQVWQNDAAGRDSNNPQPGNLIRPGSPASIDGNLRNIKSEMKGFALDPMWVNYIGNASPDPAFPVKQSGITFTLHNNWMSIATVGRMVRITFSTGGTVVVAPIVSAAFAGTDTTITLMGGTPNPLDADVWTGGISYVEFSAINPGQNPQAGGIAPTYDGSTFGVLSRSVLFADVTIANGKDYSGTTRPFSTNPGINTSGAPYEIGALIVVSNSDKVANTAAPCSLALNGGAAFDLTRQDGSDVAIGDIPAATGGTQAPMFVVMFDGSLFRIIGFMGGSVPNPITLPADPTTAMEAATKQYVDAAVTGVVAQGPTSYPITLIANLNTSPVTIASQTLPALPATGNFVLHVSYVIYVPSISTPGTGIWLDDGTAPFALCASTETGDLTFSMSAFSTTPFVGGSTPILALKGQAAAGTPAASTSPPAVINGAPTVALVVTVYRVA